jgi:hypothetical protein
MHTTEFDQLHEVAALMEGFDRPWFFAGGWALDLFLGRVRRLHRDIDITIFRRDQLAFQEHFADWPLQKIVGPDGGEYPEPWPKGEWLELPVFQVFMKVGSDGLAELEALFSETEGEEWWWRKNPQIRRPLSLFGMRSPDGLPYLSPEIVLLHKSRHLQPGHFNETKDQADFQEVVSLLDVERRAWLKTTLQTWHPDHPWIEHL